MVASQPVDVPRERAEPAPEEDLSPAGDQLIDHAVVVRIDSLYLADHVVQKDHVGVVIDDGRKEGLIPLVGGDVQRRVVAQDAPQLLQYHLRVHPCFLVLEVPPPHVDRVEVLRGAFCSVRDAVPEGRDDPGRRALDLVDVPDVVPHEALHPEVVFPVLEEQKGVEVHQQPGGVPVVGFHADGKVYPLGLLELRRVQTELVSVGVHFLQTFDRRCVDVVGLADEFLVVPEGALLLVEGRERLRVLPGAAGREGRDAAVGVPVQEVLSAVVPQPRLESLQVAKVGAVVVGPIGRGDDRLVLLVDDLSLRAELEEFLRGDDVEPDVLFAYAFHVKEVVEAEEVLFALVLVEEVHALF
eukprot:CAMPEP_0201262974 /NCGR_PEP_ID=MMETSP0853-20130426/6870_1 /ASSEMBLY_ACC=CAM_ASM_000640 /TAXON_ID=183588 /ORGANISM="Pseudo-nitzschia fraudulenta, Strain WWA7" /LENGTH=354 /DNA_ID=CAMNT_0047566433 /DNA_START=522 /DNA_END=1583 /DNA_ORIENTATION=+